MVPNKLKLTRTLKPTNMISYRLMLALLLLVASGLSQAAVLVPSPGQPVSGQQADTHQISQASSGGQPGGLLQSASVVSSQDGQLQQQQQQATASIDLASQQQHQSAMGPAAQSMMNSINGPAQPGGPISQQQQVQQQAPSATANAAAPGSPMAGQPQMSSSSSSQSQLPPTLPKINIYASRSEVKKLLGIDTSISYITNGQLNTYPLGFSIPMGYHLSDMIFTWQNLGPTNVNYSISLVIGNIHAVERPLINITRSGLIPRHEQVFKITLPCSGKITDEVDVQVLINIMGQVPVTQQQLQQRLEGDIIQGYGSDESDISSGDSVASGQQQSATDYQLARAVQQQNELLAQAAQANGQTNSSDQMQADQMQLGGDSPSGQSKPRTSPPPQPPMRTVSHTLAIKRKKICTMHPVPVQPVPRQPEIRPPNQPPPPPPMAPAIGETGGSHAHTTNKWPAAPSLEQQATPSTSGYPSERQPPVQQQVPTPVAEPSHQPIWTMTEQPIATVSIAAPQGNVAAGQGLAPVKSNSVSARQQQPSPSSFNANTRPGGQPQEPLVQHPNQNWPLPPPPPPARAPLPQVVGPNQSPSAQLDGEIMRPNTNGQAQPQGSNPLLFSLIVMSLIISVALIALLVLGSSTNSYTRRTTSPFDKLAALTNCIWRRTSAGSRAVNKCTKNVAPITIKNGIIGTFGGATNSATNARTGTGHHQHHHHASNGLKSNVSSISGLSTISGLNSSNNNTSKHGQYQNLNPLMSPYCQKQQQQQQANYNTGYYHHYQQPPDLLIGNTATSVAPITSPYQITMSNNRMTKLFLANPTSSGTYSIDNNYMPIATTNTSASSVSNGGFQTTHSDSGSLVYQTIY